MPLDEMPSYPAMLMKRHILVGLKRVDSVTLIESQTVEIQAISGFEFLPGAAKKRMLNNDERSLNVF